MPVIRNEKDFALASKFNLWRRIWRTIFGFTVLGIGIVMIVTPGPAVVVIPIGLAILATEYVWARRALKRLKQGGSKLGLWLLPRRKTARDTTPESHNDR
jgi:uncharacterized protein (TIGR02611 family)